MSKELHVSLSNVENVKEKEKMKVSATYITYLKKVVIPDKDANIERLKLAIDQKAIVIHDLHYSHKDVAETEPSLLLEIQKTRIRITAMLKRVKIFKRDIYQQLHYQ